MKVTMYSRRFCPYCVRAKRLLTDLAVTLEEISVDHEPEQHKKMLSLSGRTSVPQIWIGEEHIGGCDELMALHRSGKLAPMLLKS